MDALLIGRLLKPYGLKGHIKTVFYIDNLKELENYSHFYIKSKNKISGYQEIIFEKISGQAGQTIVKIEGCNDRNASEMLRNMDIFVDEGEIPELRGNVFYIKDLYGMDVYENSVLTGKIFNVLIMAERTLLIIKMFNNRELVVPFNDKYILDVDIKNRKIKASNLEELL